VDLSRVFVCGLGAVSPAGWDLPAMREALKKGEPLPLQTLARPGWAKPLRARLVPAPAPRPAFLAHPRLRRASPITQYAVAAALEAVAGLQLNSHRNHRLGVVVCLQSGCVEYSYRFFEEVLKDPATASPLLFSETVFAAPASHVATLLGNTPLVYTLVGDPAAFLQGLSLGAQWLEENRVDSCLVIGAEETNWLLADGLWHFEHSAVISSGAGAVCLSLDAATSLPVELCAITDAHTYTARKGRARAAQAMREQLPLGSAAELLCDGLSSSPRADAPELAAWHDWPGARLSPKRILGEGLMAATAWQCVAACDAVARGRYPAAHVSMVGCNQQAVGARFERAGSSISQLSKGAPAGNLSP
jgi:3-oxoacyl-[acyl-carrier-protein] synthase II